MFQDVSGRVMVVGASDTGKTTLVRYCRRNWDSSRGRLGILDWDPGQSRLGPPSTLAGRIEGRTSYSWFVGSVSPRGHLLPHLTGCPRIIGALQADNAELILHDTTGLVERQSAGLGLKLNPINLLQPSAVVVLERSGEFTDLTRSLPRSDPPDLYRLPAVPDTSPWSQKQRSAYRRRAFRSYFEGGEVKELNHSKRDVRPRPQFETNRLVAFSNREGFVVDLGFVVGQDSTTSTVHLKTPRKDSGPVVRLRIADLYLDPEAYRDEPAPTL